MQTKLVKWDVVIFASRESLDELVSTIQFAKASAGDLANIVVLINGNRELAAAASQRLTLGSAGFDNSHVSLWSIPFGDKANAWNVYLSRLWKGAPLAFFVDGYVKLHESAVSTLGHALEADDHALGGSGMPNLSVAELAAAHRVKPPSGFHGNFCCIKGTVIAQLRDRQIGLPLGMYRVDGLMGALLAIALNAENEWDESRILVHPGVTWATRPKRVWRWSDIRAQVKRLIRQERGAFENAAVKNHLRTRRAPPEALPKTGYRLIKGWQDSDSQGFHDLYRKSPIARWALRDLNDVDLADPSRFEPTPVALTGQSQPSR